MGGEQTIPQEAAPEVQKSGEAPAEMETVAPGPQEKSVSNGLFMSGMFMYGFSGSTASVKLDRINNETSKTTKTLRLSLYATTYEPVRGAGLTGYKLVNFPTLSPLASMHYYGDVTTSGSYGTPPDGKYWVVLVLGEYNPTGCPSNADGYCLVDSLYSVSLVRFGANAPAFNYTDMWWTPSESGWGVSLVHHGSHIVFAAWFTYDENGQPKWYVSPNCELIGDVCTGPLYETTGSPFSGTFDPKAVTVRDVGTLSLSFSGYAAGSMNYTVRGVTRTKTITRQNY
jgi:hypothetical protein